MLMSSSAPSQSDRGPTPARAREPMLSEPQPAALVFCVKVRPPDERSGGAQLHYAPFFYFSTGFHCQRAAGGGFHGRDSMSSRCFTAVAMDLGVCQLRNFSISFLSSVLAKECASVRVDNSSSGIGVVAIDNKIEQAMDLVKSHLMYAVREEVEVLKEQIKELIERNTQLEQENNLLKNLASPEQMAQFQAQVQTDGSPSGAVQPPVPGGNAQVLPSAQNSGTSA